MVESFFLGNSHRSLSADDTSWSVPSISRFERELERCLAKKDRVQKAYDGLHDVLRSVSLPCVQYVMCFVCFCILCFCLSVSYFCCRNLA